MLCHHKIKPYVGILVRFLISHLKYEQNTKIARYLSKASTVKYTDKSRQIKKHKKVT